MPEDQKVQVEAEEKDTSQEAVDVTPAPKVAEEDQLAAKIKSDFEALYGSRLKQAEDRLHGAYRIQEKLQKEVEMLRTQVKPSAVTATDPKDPWAGIENGQTWKSEIEKLAEQKAEEKLRTWQQQQQHELSVQQQWQVLESSKQKVVSKYPDLDPDTGTEASLVSQTYKKVLNEHPDWRTNPYGPELAMHAMEEQLTSAAKSLGSPKPAARAAQASLSPSRPTAGGDGRITLTREQKAFCDRHQIKYEDYVKTLAAVEQGAVEA